MNAILTTWVNGFIVVGGACVTAYPRRRWESDVTALGRFSAWHCDFRKGGSRSRVETREEYLHYGDLAGFGGTRSCRHMQEQSEDQLQKHDDIKDKVSAFAVPTRMLRVGTEPRRVQLLCSEQPTCRVVWRLTSHRAVRRRVVSDAEEVVGRRGRTEVSCRVSFYRLHAVVDDAIKKRACWGGVLEEKGMLQIGPMRAPQTKKTSQFVPSARRHRLEICIRVEGCLN